MSNPYDIPPLRRLYTLDLALTASGNLELPHAATEHRWRHKICKPTKEAQGDDYRDAHVLSSSLLKRLVVPKQLFLVLRQNRFQHVRLSPRLHGGGYSEQRQQHSNLQKLPK